MLNYNIQNLPFCKIGVDIAEFQGHNYIVIVPINTSTSIHDGLN